MALKENDINNILDTFGRRWDETPKPVVAPTQQVAVASPPTVAPITTPEIETDNSKRRLPKLKDLNKEDILALIDAILHFDPLVIQDSDTYASNLEDLTLEQRMAIRSVEIREEKEKGVKVGQIVKITFWDKLTAIELAGKYKKMFQAESETTTNNFVIITDRLERGQQRMRDIRKKTQSLVDADNVGKTSLSGLHNSDDVTVIVDEGESLEAIENTFGDFFGGEG